jgi:hypothetical protein
MKNYRTLDAIVVCAGMALAVFIVWTLAFHNIPDKQLPIFAGLAGTVFGATVGAYSGARWANKKTDEPAPGTVTTTGETTVITPPASPAVVKAATGKG